jgi:hypothetical protein
MSATRLMIEPNPIVMISSGPENGSTRLRCWRSTAPEHGHKTRRSGTEGSSLGIGRGETRRKPLCMLLTPIILSLYFVYTFFMSFMPMASSEVARRTFGAFTLKGFLLRMAISAHMPGAARVTVISVLLLSRLV